MFVVVHSRGNTRPLVYGPFPTHDAAKVWFESYFYTNPGDEWDRIDIVEVKT